MLQLDSEQVKENANGKVLSLKSSSSYIVLEAFSNIMQSTEIPIDHFRFLELSRELRNRIYTYVLATEDAPPESPEAALDRCDGIGRNVQKEREPRTLTDSFGGAAV